MSKPYARRRWHLSLGLAASILAIVASAPAPALASGGAATGATQATASGVVPTAPQNLRAIYRDGVFDGITWDASASAGNYIRYEVFPRGVGFMHGTPCCAVFHTTLYLRDLVDWAYLELGYPYTFTVVAYGAGNAGPSQPSNQLAVTLPPYPTW